MGTISKNFSYCEFEKTDHRQFKFKNIITSAEVRDNIRSLVWVILQPLRDRYDKPMVINSGYRCRELNNYLPDSSPNSQHTKGQAADIYTGSPEESHLLAKLAKDMQLPYDQMILYPTFVHFSYKAYGKNRGQILYNSTYKGKRL